MSTELVTKDLTEEALISAAKADLGDSGDFTVPMLKVAQSLTHEVQEGEAEVGEFIHSLTGEVYGTTVKIVVVDAFKGRAWKNKKTGDFFSANREPVVPWEEHSCHGEAFVDCHDAEEQYRARVRANEIDWGTGPGISTTYNFVGLVVKDDDGVESFPVRLSLQRSSAKEGRKWTTMLAIARAPWDLVYEVSTVRAQSKRGEPYIGVRVKQIRKTTDEEKRAALEVAQTIHGTTNVAYHEAGGAEDGAPIQPSDAPTGGIEL